MTPSEANASDMRGLSRPDNHRERAEALNKLVASFRQERAGWSVVERLLAGDRSAQRLALELVPRLPLPVESHLIDPLRDHVNDVNVPLPLRIAIASHLLCSLPSTGEQTSAVIDALTAEVGSARSLNRLRQVGDRVIGCAALEERIAQLEARVSMRCPRCEIKLSRPEMVKHLWQEHRLILEGRRVRQPWRLVEDWLREYITTDKVEFLERGTELAEQLDPLGGGAKIQRLLLAKGRTDAEALQNLKDEARRREATLCPHCFALVPEPSAYAIPPMTIARGRIAARGFAVEVSDHGLVPQLLIDIPGEPTQRFRAPRQWLTSHAISFLVAGPWVVLALLTAWYMPTEWGLPVVPVLGFLLLGYLLHRYNHWLTRKRAPNVDWAIRMAWKRLVPRLFEEGYHSRDAEFLGSLANVSADVGKPTERESTLESVTAIVREAVIQDNAPIEQLVALRRLAIADTAKSDRDPILVLAADIAASLDGELPLDYAEQMLQDWEGTRWWTRGNQARLRVLLCARAFETGLGVWEIQELGRVCPQLGEAFKSEDLDGLARLRRLWRLRLDRPWRHCGEATPIYDLARYPVLGGQFLQAHSDLLLFQPMNDGEDESGRSAPILICEEGVVYRDQLLRPSDGPVKLIHRPIWQGRGYELIAGPLKVQFRKRPAGLVKQLNCWLHYLFDEFLPSVDQELQKHYPAALDRLLEQKQVECPECEQVFLRQRHDVGISLEERGEG